MFKGLVLGWVLVPLIVGLMAYIGAPDAGLPFWAGVGAVVGFWCGLFLGGVFTLSAFQLRVEREAEAAARAHVGPADPGASGASGEAAARELGVALTA